ncbi:ligand-binding sensor domain-containing protein/AraC-like DNA-binding protein [Algoriphagus sp. 4150]|uniref:two-component regulator propeller domain-containing protein n=1 Tax=Algoriphagus sp. 4150 TaxID=2817756 RepID=UPI002854B7DB|nr:two-component regulator propeller domain-containing protein [Algoriphagus sp. 4150]MDR7130058.1 ligand-binding sensor domain-containing protein/AraC-like DNA-binding protein [Algoriphagus sp. 4150]
MSPRCFIFFTLILFLVPLSCSQAQKLKFRTYLVEDGLSNNSVNLLANDPSGAIWIGTWNGLNLYDGKSFLVFRHHPTIPHSLPGNYIYGVEIDKDERVWVWSDPKILSLFHADSTFSHYKFEDRISKTFLTSQRQVAVQIVDSLFVYDGEKDSFQVCSSCIPMEKSADIPLPSSISQLSFFDSKKDKRGNIWYGSKDQGLFFQPYHVQSGEPYLEHYPSDAFHPFGLRSNEVTAILEDHFGNVWLGLKDGGVARTLRHSNVVSHIYPHPKKHPNLPSEAVRAVAEEADGTLWIGYYNSGLYFRRPGENDFEKLDIPSSHSGSDWNRIRSLYVDQTGQVWSGTYAGVIKIRKTEIVELVEEENTEFFYRRVYGFAEDKQSKRLWIGSWNGVSLYNLEKQRFENFKGREQLEGMNIRTVFYADSSLYIATEKHGVAIVKDGEITFFDRSKGLLDNSVYSILKEEDTDRIWIGTHSGVTLWDPKTDEISYITELEGLMSNFIYGILSHANSIWVSTAKGIARINKETLEVWALDPEEGWQSSEFSEGAYFKSGRGLMYFGGVNGLNSFHPNDLRSEFAVPRIRVLQQEFSHTSAYSASFAISEVGFGIDPNNRILYRVLPGDTDWSELGQNGFLHLSGLSEGVHKLEVKNSLGRPGEVLVTEFTVLVPLWKKPLVYFFVVMFVLGVAGWWRVRAVKRIQTKLELKIQERTGVISRQKSDLENANRVLEAKNREIEEQKARLQILHSKHQNAGFEMEKFTGYVLDQIRKPLSDLKLSIESATFRDSKLKNGVRLQLDRLMELFSEINGSNKLMYLGKVTPSLTILPDLFLHLNQEMSAALKQNNIQYKYSENLPKSWVSLDVMRLKLFLQNVFKELLKFLDDAAVLDVRVLTLDANLLIRVNTTSSTLMDAIDTFSQYSIYIQSAKSLLAEMSGEMQILPNESSVAISIRIPFQEIETKNLNTSVKNWKHMALADEIPEGKKIVLIYGKRFEADGLVKVMEEDSLFFIQEDDPDMVSSALNTIRVDLLILYNEKVTENVAKIISASNSFPTLPILFMYEILSYGQQERLLDMGIKDFIQLPTGKSLLSRKIKSLLAENIDKDQPLKLESILSQDELKVDLSPNEKLLREAIHHIKLNFDKPSFKVETLYEHLGVSKIKLYRIFKDILHLAPFDVIQQLRMEKANTLLQKSQMNVTEVSFACGFNDPKHFGKIFKKHYGYSPKKFQQMDETGNRGAGE